MPCIVRCFAVAFLPFCFSHRAADQSCLPDAKAVRAAPSLLAVSQHLQRKGAVGNQSKEAAVAPNDDLAQTLEDALSWEIKQIEKSMGEPTGDEKPSKVMGVALNGKDDLRMLRGAVIIGFAGVALLFIVFCLMRKFAPWVYLREEDMELEPLGDGTASPATAPRFFANPHVTLLDWTRKVRQTTPEDEMAAAGLDGWAFLEFRRLIWRIFSVIGAMLAVVLLPMHYQAHKDSQMLDILSIFDIGRDPLPDWMLWVHAVMVWFVVGASSWTISMAQEHFTERRYQWLKEIPFPRANTVLVRNIPAMYRSDAALLQYFTNVFNDKDAVERAYVVRRTGQLPRQVKNLKAAKLEVLHAKQHWEEAGSEEETPEWFYLQRCQKRVKTITEEVAAAQGRLKDAAARGDPLVCTSTGFVTFNTELTARLASREQYTRDVTDFQISMPPDPEDVIYDNLADQEINSTGWNWAGVAAIWGVFTIWIPFVVLISSWTTFGAVQEMLPSLKEFVQQHPWLDKILTGVFATIALKVVLAFLPTALYLIIRNLMSVKSSSEAQILMQRWYGLFLVMFVLLVTSLSRGVTLTLVSIAQKPGRIFSLLADFLPSASHFYFNYMILGWTAGSVPDPCLYFTTDSSTREVELELPKWKEGKFLVVKFLDTHNNAHNGQRNIDVGIIGMIGYTGRFAKQQIPLGPWMKRSVRQPWVHPNELKSMFSSSGWVCDGRDFTGGCRSGQTDFHQTNVYTVTFRCTTSGFDLCEKCAHDPTLGRINDDAMQSDLEALLDPSMCKLAVSRLRNLWRRNWVESLSKYFKAGLLDNLVQALQKCTENPRPEDERAPNQRQSTETQKRQARRAMLQLLTELTQRILGGVDLGQGSNDLVWAIRSEEDQHHWDEGRIVQQPKKFLETLGRPLPPPAGLSAATLATGTEGGVEADESPGDAAGSSAPTEAVNTEAEATPEGKEASKEGHFLISWRDGQAPSWVHPQHVWRIADEDVVMATAGLFLELAKGPHCDTAKLSKLLQQGADLSAANGEGCPALLLAVRAEAPVAALTVLLENGACPDAAGREGVTALELLLRKEREESADAEWIRQCADVLRRNRATLEATQEEHEARLIELRRSFGIKMVGALLLVQSPTAVPAEVLEALHLLFRDLPKEVVKESLEPQAYCALAALLQHLVGSTDNLGVALVGCRIMRALYNQPELKLRYLIRSHGVLRWTQRLRGDITQCGIHRQGHHDKVTAEELSKEAQLLAEDLRQGEPTDLDAEWRNNQKLMEVVQALHAAGDDAPGRLAPADGLFALRELLKKTEKGGLDEERCTAWELEQAGVPGLMLQYLMDGTSRVNQDRWKLFTEAFGDSSKQSKKGLTRFIKAMHAVIETGETLPITVWKHKKERGLKALTEPLALKLRSVRNGEVQTQKLQVAAEPLLQLADLTRFLTKVTPCVDEAYLQFCHRIIGHRIRDLHSEKEYEVKSFETYTLGLPIPIHTVMATDGEATESWVLANRAYHILGDLAATNVAQLELKVAFNIIQALSGDYMASLEQLQERLDGAEAAKISEATLAAALASALQMAEANRQEVLDFLAAEKARCAAASGPATGGATSDGATEAALDPNMRVHTVMIAVSDEIPFELFWPMVKDDIVAAVRELRGSPGMEEAVQQGVLQNGMGPIAKKLTLQEAENLATRVGHVVQTGVTVDPEALQEAQKEKANSQQNESIQLSYRVQFNRENSWVPGTVVGQLGDMLSLVDDEGVLFDKLPRARVRLPPGKRDSLGSAGVSPIQAVLSQADLVRIREHLRRRQEEWAERRAQNTGSGGNGARADEAAAGSEQRTPTSSRPTSAPVPALVHRSRASSAPSIDGAGALRRGILLSRDASLSEVDAAGLDVVQFMEDEGMGDDDFDDEEGGPDDEDEEDLALEPQEDVDMAPRLGGSRGSDGENRDLGEPGSLEEELRMLEQLRAMEQIISEVLDPAEGGRPRRRDGEDFALGAPMASLRIRMGGGLRLPVEGMSQIRRGKGIVTEPLRGEFPSFVRSADASSATATLDHPVVERLGVSDLKACEGDVPMAEPEGVPAPVLTARLCLYPKETDVTDEHGADAAAKVQPILLPRSWNLLKAMQYLQQQGSEGKAEVEPVQKVPLENWDLGYELVMEGSTEDGSAMEVDSVGATRTASSFAVALGSGKKRRRTLPFNELSDAVAREMYSQVLCPEKGEPVTSLVERGDNITVTQAIELLRLMHSFAPSLNLEVSNWVSSKLDRKLRYQLEDPFSVISGTLPRWAVTLPKVCPFLFSLKTRKMLMKYTAFGPSFAVHWTQEHKVGSFLKRRATVQTELNAQTDPRKMQKLSQELSNIEEHVVRSNYWLGTLQSTLVRLEKGEEFLRQADVAMGFLAKASKLMEVQFEGETGFGVAVTQSFYVEVAQALQDRSVNSSIPMWVEDDDSGTGQQHLLCRKGLLLKPLPPGPQRDQVVHRFRFLGRLMGQALREGFIVPLPLADEFFALLLDEPLGPSNLPKPGHGVAGELLGALNEFLEDLALNEPQGPEERQAWRRAQAERSDFGERFLTASDRPDASPQEPMSFNEYTRLVGLCFLETGLSGAELCPEGDSIAVTADNVTRFVEEAANFWFNTGVREQVNAFRAGLNDVFPFNELKAFTRTELREMFCGEDRIDWDEPALLNHIRPTGGLTEKSPSYKFLVAVLLEMGQAERSRFLDFVSSCPRLPPGGIAKFHVDVFPDTNASGQAFPRSRACANQLYLPPYTSKEELQAKLVEAMHSSAGHHEQRVRDQ